MSNDNENFDAYTSAAGYHLKDLIAQACGAFERESIQDFNKVVGKMSDLVTALIENEPVVTASAPEHPNGTVDSPVKKAPQHPVDMGEGGEVRALGLFAAELTQTADGGSPRSSDSGVTE